MTALITPTNESTAAEAALNLRYATHLQFLWEQYNKLMNLGLIGSTATLVFLLNGIILNKDVREVILDFGEPLESDWLVAAIIMAATASFCFIMSRWCSQILMERQVYGKRDEALKYFRDTLDNETVYPTAIQTKFYMEWITAKKLLKFIGNLNELAKWSGILLMILSWAASFRFAWPLITSLR